MRLAASYTNSPSDRDDLFQDSALAIWKALPGFRGESAERTFIFRIAQNRAITFISQRRPQSAPDEQIDLPDPGPIRRADLRKNSRKCFDWAGVEP